MERYGHTFKWHRGQELNIWVEKSGYLQLIIYIPLSRCVWIVKVKKKKKSQLFSRQTHLHWTEIPFLAEDFSVVIPAQLHPSFTGDPCSCSSWTILPSIAQQWNCTPVCFFFSIQKAARYKAMRCCHTLVILQSGLLISGFSWPWPFISSWLFVMCYWLPLHSTLCSEQKTRGRWSLIVKGGKDYHLDSQCSVVFIFTVCLCLDFTLWVYANACCCLCALFEIPCKWVCALRQFRLCVWVYVSHPVEKISAAVQCDTGCHAGTN